MYPYILLPSNQIIYWQEVISKEKPQDLPACLYFLLFIYLFW